MPVKRNATGDVTTITGNATWGYRGVLCLTAIKLYLQTGMLTTRGATPRTLLTIATEFTGKPYKNSRKNLEQALADLTELKAGKSLDELGETAIVNKELGGVAAALDGPQCNCPECGVFAIVPLTPAPRLAQPDDTTHVCHPNYGGCNRGFTDDRTRA